MGYDSREEEQRTRQGIRMNISKRVDKLIDSMPILIKKNSIIMQ